MVDNQQNVDPVCFPLKIIACASARLSSPILALAILKKGKKKYQEKNLPKIILKKEFKFASLHVRPHDWVHPLWPDHATDPNPISTSQHLHIWMRPPIGRGRVRGVRCDLDQASGMLTKWPQVLTRLTNYTSDLQKFSTLLQLWGRKWNNSR